MRKYYVKDVNSAFNGDGQEIVAVEDDVVIDHVRVWENPTVVDDDFDPMREGDPFDLRLDGWRRAVGEEEREIDDWFYEWVG